MAEWPDSLLDGKRGRAEVYREAALAERGKLTDCERNLQRAVQDLGALEKCRQSTGAAEAAFILRGACSGDVSCAAAGVLRELADLLEEK